MYGYFWFRFFLHGHSKIRVKLFPLSRHSNVSPRLNLRQWITIWRDDFHHWRQKLHFIKHRMDVPKNDSRIRKPKIIIKKITLLNQNGTLTWVTHGLSIKLAREWVILRFCKSKVIGWQVYIKDSNSWCLLTYVPSWWCLYEKVLHHFRQRQW